MQLVILDDFRTVTFFEQFKKVQGSHGSDQGDKASGLEIGRLVVSTPAKFLHCTQLYFSLDESICWGELAEWTKTNVENQANPD